MIKKLLKLIYEAIAQMVGYKSVSEALDITQSTISDDMSEALELWKDMYKDQAPWLDDVKGVFSMGLPKLICSIFKQQILSEVDTSVVDPAKPDEEYNIKDEPVSRSQFIERIYKLKMMKTLPDALEKALNCGGMIIKPYENNGNIYIDYCMQGDFYPISFDDDGNITDIAFFDSFVDGDFIYSKIERQTFVEEENMVIVENKAFKAKKRTADEDVEQELGVEINLTEVPKWAGISQEPVYINNVNHPLYGYYKVSVANNVDIHSPLGMSIYGAASKAIKKADEQFSRLDWEYKGGQLAIDVDPTAVTFSQGYFGTMQDFDDLQDRLYRKLDLGTDETYHAWAPSLRDANYREGLNFYLMMIEDIVGMARGTISNVQVEARTATEIKVLKQRAYITISSNQDALGVAIRDTINAINTYIDLYNIFQSGEYDLVIEWKDSVLTDTDTELEQKLKLVDKDILSKEEVRAWYTGENEEVAKQKIDVMQKAKQETYMKDLFGNGNQNTNPNIDVKEE